MPATGSNAITKPLPRKPSCKLQRELDALPNEIEQLETHIGVQQQLSALREIAEQLERNVERWAELEQLAADIARTGKTAET